LREDVSLYYELTSGGLAPVILLHGWSCDHTFLAPQAAHFGCAGHAVVSLDFRGHGRSDKPEQPYLIGGFADDVASICGELELAKPILIGHSMGGSSPSISPRDGQRHPGRRGRPRGHGLPVVLRQSHAQPRATGTHATGARRVRARAIDLEPVAPR
jgi:hypothetical protein